MKKKSQAAAVIDIGSSEIRLHIAETGAQSSNSVKYLDKLIYPLSLGRDTFHAGKINFDKVDKACEIIRNFLHAARGYGVRNVRTIAGTAMREAENADYILDQIKIKTGVEVHVVDDLEEKMQIYKLLSYYAKESLKKSAIVVYSGTGSIGISLYAKGRMPRTWNIRAGSLRMGELFGDQQEYTKDFYRLMEEYLAGFTKKLRAELPKGIEHFIVSGTEIEAISRLVTNSAPPSDSPLFDVPRADYEEFYDTVKRKTVGRISLDYGIDIHKAESLLPAACIYHDLLGCTEANAITVTCMLPCDAYLFEMLYPKLFSAVEKAFVKCTILSARELAKEHDIDVEHGELVSEYSNMIFDKLKKLHGLGGRDKILLTIAALLHDVGKSVNDLDHNFISYEIVRRLNLVGLTQKEQEIIALICRYHSGKSPGLEEPNYVNLDSGTRVRVSKLTSMLRLADALDRSSTRIKYKSLDVKLCESALHVTGQTSEYVALEEWTFKEKSGFFEEVFGIKAVLRIKR